MDENLFTYVNTAIETVLDEQKYLSYTSLCRELCIHINVSKCILYQAVKKIKNEKPKVLLNVNYILSGLVNDNKAKTIVCTETELPSTRKLFKSIFYEHVYSVSMGKPVVDKVALICSNSHEDMYLCSGLIKSNQCIKRPLSEINQLIAKSQEVMETVVKPQPSKGGIKVESDNMVARPQETKSEPVLNNDEENSLVQNCLKDQKSNKNNKSQKGIVGFFNKANSVPSVKSNSLKNTSQELKTETLKNNTAPKKENNMEVAQETAKLKAIKMEISDDENHDSPSHITNKIKKKGKVDKNRKRVLQVSDSESDNEEVPFEDDISAKIKDDSDDEIPPTPTPTVQVKSGILNPKKKRKVIDKTYTDEDGYILTRKEEVYESCSDNEIENCSEENNLSLNKKQITPKLVISPKKPGKNNKKKISSPQKGKQSSIMSFFQKK